MQISYLFLVLAVVLFLSIAFRGKVARYLTIVSSLSVLAFTLANDMTFSSFNYGSFSILTLTFQLNFVSSY